MKINPVKGTNDYLPEQVRLRDYLQSQILNVYVENGFEHIITPVVEDAENLDKSDGGENLNLIFNILKRGDKLESVINKGVTVENQKELSDLGLRYDLTLPLSRYIANNQNELLMPMKCIQIDRVYRAERPQKGRLREFIQCDIDIIGSESSDSELELILTTVKALKAIGLSDFTVKINDRRLLTNVLTKLGFDRDLDSVCISFDKMDKIGLDGVAKELASNGFAEESIERYMGLFKGLNEAEDGVAYLAETLGDCLEGGAAENLKQICEAVTETTQASFKLQFDPTLVRGMSYYTGTIFEIGVEGFPGSIAGGGRYDKMVGKFTGMETPACGFSIGFERIVTILLDEGFTVPGSKEKIAYLVEKGVDSKVLGTVLQEAMAGRAAGQQILVAWMNKNKKFQKEQLTAEGYSEFKEFYKEALK